MNIEEFNKALKELESSFRADKNQLLREFALSNNTVKIGDVVADELGSIIVDRITVSVSAYSSKPSFCTYIGVVLNKNGEKNKRMAKRQVLQTRMVSI